MIAIAQTREISTTRTEKSSIVLGECSSLNVYSNLHVSHENVNCLVLCISVAQSKNSTEQTPRKVDPEIKGQNNKNLNLKSEKLENLKSDNQNKNCKPKYGESNNFKSKNSLLKSAKGQNLKIELENRVFRNEALKNNVSQKNLNFLVKNLENKVSEDLPVNNCINPLKTRQNLAEISRNDLCHPLHNQNKKYPCFFFCRLQLFITNYLNK